MDDLLAGVLDSHGGLENWTSARALTAHLSLGGPFWGMRGWPGAWTDQTVHVDTRRERIDFAPYPEPGHQSVYEVDGAGERIRIVGPDGLATDERLDPRPSFPAYDNSVAWDAIQTAYFTSVATWNYLVAPFLFTYPGVEAHEIEPWQEDGETWRRLAVRFPDTLPNHNPDQTFYYDDDLVQRRMDYLPDVTGAPIAHYTHDPVRFDGFLFYGHRAVHLRNADGVADRSLAVITIDTTAIEVIR